MKARRSRTGSARYIAIQIVLGVFASSPARAQSWSAAASMSTTRYWHTATLLDDGTVLVAGGRSGSSVAASAELYDPSTDSWSTTGSMSSPRYLHTATLLAEGYVLVTGGYRATSGDNVLSSAEYYDPSLQSWVPVDEMQFARAAHTATLLPSGAVLVAGGRAQSSLPVEISETWSSVDGWTAAGALVTPRFNHAAAAFSGGVLLTGGNTVTSWEMTSETSDGAGWSSAPSMSMRRALHVATVLADGRVLVSGGENFGTPTPSAEIYDGSWTVTGSLSGRRASHAAALLYDGTVLACGGENFIGTARVRTAELYDPSAQTWSSVDDMLSARATHTATLLLDGRVLVTGGVSSAGQLSTAELYAGPAPGGGAVATR